MSHFLNEGRKEGRKHRHRQTYNKFFTRNVVYNEVIKSFLHFFFCKIYNELVLIIVTKYLLNKQFVLKRLYCYEVFV